MLKFLKEIAKSTGKSIEIILVGAQALPYYGVKARATMDIDAEIVRGDLEEVYFELKKKEGLKVICLKT